MNIINTSLVLNTVDFSLAAYHVCFSTLDGQSIKTIKSDMPPSYFMIVFFFKRFAIIFGPKTLNFVMYVCNYVFFAHINLLRRPPLNGVGGGVGRQLNWLPISDKPLIDRRVGYRIPEIIH